MEHSTQKQAFVVHNIILNTVDVHAYDDINNRYICTVTIPESDLYPEAGRSIVYLHMHNVIRVYVPFTTDTLYTIAMDISIRRDMHGNLHGTNVSIIDVVERTVMHTNMEFVVDNARVLVGTYHDQTCRDSSTDIITKWKLPSTSPYLADKMILVRLPQLMSGSDDKLVTCSGSVDMVVVSATIKRDISGIFTATNLSIKSRRCVYDI